MSPGRHCVFAPAARMALIVVFGASVVACTPPAPPPAESTRAPAERPAPPQDGAAVVENPFASSQPPAAAEQPPKLSSAVASLPTDGGQSAADPGKGQFALAGEVGNLKWQTMDKLPVNYARRNVRLSGPNGLAIDKVFGPGEAIAIDQNLPDGLYKWEVVSEPEVDAAARREMAAVRESGDAKAERALIARLRSSGQLPTEEQARANRQSGLFRLQGGQLVQSQQEK